MKTQQSKTFKYLMTLGLVLLLLRFFPIIIRLSQGLLMVVRAYWWLVAPILILGFVARKLKKQRLLMKKKEAATAAHPIRDVTPSR